MSAGPGTLPKCEYATRDRRNYGPILLTALAIGVVIVLGVNAFLAQGPPSAPVVQPVRMFPATTANPWVTLWAFASFQMYSLQPPNSIDELGTKVTITAWEDGRVLALNTQLSANIIGVEGHLYTMGVNFGIGLLPTCPGCPTNATLTIVAKALVPIYYDTFSAVSSTTLVLSDGTANATPSGGSGDPPAAGLYNWALYGSVTAAAAFGCLLAFAIIRDARVLYSAATLGLLLLTEAAMWVA